MSATASGLRDATQVSSFVEDCPYCGGRCECDLVDVGVGYVQAGPFHCESCGASQIGPRDEPRELSDEEKRTGWYGPGAEPGSSANVIEGRIVGYRQMEQAYRAAFAGDPAAWHRSGAVAEWFEDVRKKKV